MLSLYHRQIIFLMQDMTASSAVMQFPQEIVKLMLLLLSYRTEEAIRCVVQVLKVCFAYIKYLSWVTFG